MTRLGFGTWFVRTRIALVNRRAWHAAEIWHTQHVSDTEVVHVVYSSNSQGFMPLEVSVISLVTNTLRPELVVVHIFEEESDPLPVLMLRKWIQSKGSRIEIHSYNQAETLPFVNGFVRNTRLKDPSNYVRFIIPNHLPDSIKKCIWIDADTIVKRGIVPLVQSLFHDDVDHHKAVAAFPRNQRGGVDGRCRKILSDQGIQISPKAFPSFNAGVLGLNLQEWRVKGYQQQIRRICKLNMEFDLWPSYGSQPPLLAIFSGNQFQKINPALTVGKLGDEDRIEYDHSAGNINAIFLHWNGQAKPWREDGGYKQEWLPYWTIAKNL